MADLISKQELIRQLRLNAINTELQEYDTGWNDGIAQAILIAFAMSPQGQEKQEVKQDAHD